jgi:GT2 family glycosyltransferase
MDLSIIVVNWNSIEYMRACLRSVYAYSEGFTFEIIVVDNASPEGGAGSICEEFPSVILIESERNLGFAGANNLGCNRARGEFVLLLNPDTELLENSIAILLRAARSLSGAGIVGCKLLNSDRSIQLSSIKRFPTILNQALESESLQRRWPKCPLWRLDPLFADDMKLVPVEVIPGACMLMRRSVFEQVGMLSEDYFMYAEDLDLNVKMRRAGYTNYYVGETAIVHHGGGSSSRQKLSHWATVMQCRAMALYFRKVRGPLYQKIYEASLAIVALSRLILLALAGLFGASFVDPERRRCSWAKWILVLQWAAGRRTVSLPG